jgi:sugar lactone lactonase YvrE
MRGLMRTKLAPAARAIALMLLMALAACVAQAEPSPDRVRAFYPEGALYVGETLYYAEMGADRISRIENGRRTDFYREEECGPTAIAPYGTGFLILCHIGAHVVAVDARGHRIRSWDKADDGGDLQDPNDVTADGHGGVYFSDPGIFSRRTLPAGSLMHLDAQGRLTRALRDLWYPNGVYADVARGRLYMTEHMSGKVWLFDLDAAGAISNRRLFVDAMSLLTASRYRDPYPETGPDGLEIGPNGDLYQAIYGAGRILRISPQGQLVDVIDTPARYVTNISFDPHGNAATTGSFDNLTPPYPGEVRFFPASRLTRRPD